MTRSRFGVADRQIEAPAARQMCYLLGTGHPLQLARTAQYHARRPPAPPKTAPRRFPQRWVSAAEAWQLDSKALTAPSPAGTAL